MQHGAVLELADTFLGQACECPCLDMHHDLVALAAGARDGTRAEQGVGHQHQRVGV